MEGHTDADAPADMLTFNIQYEASRLTPRVGELLIRGRQSLKTPGLVVSTSRGTIPHVTPDLVQKHTPITAVYAGLEDFLQKPRKDAPVVNVAQELVVHGSVLRAYTALPDQCLSILGPRRIPSISTPHQSTDDALAISSSFGFASIDIEDYNIATENLRPDVSISILDLVQEDRISQKRIGRSADRTHAWLRDTIDTREKLGGNVSMFASIPPLEREQQSFYLSDLADEYKQHLSGVCIYEHTTAEVIPEGLSRLPILCLSNPDGPHDLLTAISLGVDLITTPFVTNTSEAGIALTFTFIGPVDGKDEPLGIDMWSTSYATDVSSLAPSCSCYACTRHHRAYVHHLLQAKEMLAWTLLQIHNFHIVNQFLEAIRESILEARFEQDWKAFRLTYEKEMPQKTGQGPRVRGYQVRILGRGGLPKNAKAYNNLDERARKVEEAESDNAVPDPSQDAGTLENLGLGNKVD